VIAVALSKGPKRVGASSLSSKDGNIFDFQNVVFFRTPDHGQSPKINPCFKKATWVSRDFKNLKLI
jgi:hypothetical protein